jgi:hypothetical protein
MGVTLAIIISCNLFVRLSVEPCLKGALFMDILKLITFLVEPLDTINLIIAQCVSPKVLNLSIFNPNCLTHSLNAYNSPSL